MSVTDAEYAMLSNAVYHKADTYIPPENYDFTRIDQREDDVTGFYGEVYQRGDDIVIVFRGSKNMLNYGHDLQWGINGAQPPEFRSAKIFYEDIMKDYGNKGFSISMTGHSLGGSMVQYNNAWSTLEGGYQVPGVAFAPAGVGDFFPGLDPESIAVKNYIRDSDVVPGIKNVQLGYESVPLAWKNESYEVRYNDEGIGEIVSTPATDAILTQHAMLGYWVDVGHLQTRPAAASQNYIQDKYAPYLPSDYFQTPEQQAQSTANIVDLESRSFDFNTMASFDIVLQSGKWTYKTTTEDYKND